MTIGFTERMQRVSEGAYPDDLFPVSIRVGAARTAEQMYQLMFILEPNHTATVKSLRYSSLDYDALFSNSDHLNIVKDLIHGEKQIDPLTVYIRNDLAPEKEECFTIRILPVKNSGSFMCNDDGAGNLIFFCKHTICIENDDGKCQP